MMAPAAHAARQGLAVLTVGGHHGVLGREGLHHADRHRLLADVEVQEAADLRGAVQLGRISPRNGG